MACPVVDCSRVECSSKCGRISWFGNMSDCTVRLEYQHGSDGLWHSLGEYAPGMHSELGGGTLLLPSDSNIRVVDVNGKVVQNYGRLGDGLHTLYVDSSMCQTSTKSTASSASVGSIKKDEDLSTINIVAITLASIACLMSIWVLVLFMKRQKA